MTDKLVGFFSIPQEIRDEIYELLLLQPAAPVFEGKEKGTKYKNYLGIMYVNKEVYKEVHTALYKLKPLTVLSCNIEDMDKHLTSHAIPYISKHEVWKVKAHSLRLHVKFLGPQNRPKVLKAYVLLTSDMKETCNLLRSLSLLSRAAPYLLFGTYERIPPRMSIALRLECCNRVSMSEENKVCLLKQLTSLNHAGKVLVLGCDKQIAKAILPGRQVHFDDPDDLLNPWKQSLKEDHEDVLDVIRLASWKNSIGKIALEAGDYELACDRYAMTLDFIREYTDYTLSMINNDRSEELQFRLDMQSIVARLGVVKCRMEEGQWLDAGLQLLSLFHVMSLLPHLEEFETYLVELESYILKKISQDEAELKKAKQLLRRIEEAERDGPEADKS